MPGAVDGERLVDHRGQMLGDRGARDAARGARARSAKCRARMRSTTPRRRASRVRKYREVVPGGSPASASTARWVRPRAPSRASNSMAASARRSRRTSLNGGIGSPRLSVVGAGTGPHQLAQRGADLAAVGGRLVGRPGHVPVRAYERRRPGSSAGRRTTTVTTRSDQPATVRRDRRAVTVDQHEPARAQRHVRPGRRRGGRGRASAGRSTGGAPAGRSYRMPMPLSRPASSPDAGGNAQQRADRQAPRPRPSLERDMTSL